MRTVTDPIVGDGVGDVSGVVVGNGWRTVYMAPRRRRPGKSIYANVSYIQSLIGRMDGDGLDEREMNGRWTRDEWEMNEVS